MQRKSSIQEEEVLILIISEDIVAVTGRKGISRLMFHLKVIRDQLVVEKNETMVSNLDKVQNTILDADKISTIIAGA